jgi:hypothetical protein
MVRSNSRNVAKAASDPVEKRREIYKITPAYFAHLELPYITPAPVANILLMMKAILMTC